MGLKPQRDLEEDIFWRKLILPEEDRRNRPSPPQWNSSFRWFRSPNIVDLWYYRGAAEKKRISEFMLRF